MWAQQRQLVSSVRSYCTEEKLQEIRDPVAQLLTKFLSQQIVETSLEYRRTFTGLLQQIVNFYMRGKRHQEIFTSIPLAACVWLAVNHSLSHKLRAVLGDTNLVRYTERESWNQENQQCSVMELTMRLPEVKALEQLEAARFIVRK